MDIIVKKLIESAKLPHKFYESDTGYIVNANRVENIFYHSGGNGEKIAKTEEVLQTKFDTPTTFGLQYHERALIGTGLQISCPGYYFNVLSLMEKTFHTGIMVISGIINSSYTGELKIVVINTSRQVQHITLHEPIARIIPVKNEEFNIKLDEIIKTDRPDNSLSIV